MALAPTVLRLASQEETARFGGAFADAGLERGVVHLEGDLGAGKTTWVRGFLRRIGVGGAIRSPTFTLVEPYAARGLEIYHFDLYRLSDPVELEHIGLRDYLGSGALCFFEWPERAAGVVPAPDLRVRLRHEPAARAIEIHAAGEAYGRIAHEAEILFLKHSNR